MGWSARDWWLGTVTWASGVHCNVYLEAAEQRCWNHKILNVLDKLPNSEHAQAKLVLCHIPYAESHRESERHKSRFLSWCLERGHQAAAEALERDWGRMMTFYQFPKEHWQHLRTTNLVESPFAALRLRTDAAKRYEKVARATAVIWKMLMVDVYDGTQYVDGVRVHTTTEEIAA